MTPIFSSWLILNLWRMCETHASGLSFLIWIWKKNKFVYMYRPKDVAWRIVVNEADVFLSRIEAKFLRTVWDPCNVMDINHDLPLWMGITIGLCRSLLLYRNLTWNLILSFIFVFFPFLSSFFLSHQNDLYIFVRNLLKYRRNSCTYIISDVNEHQVGPIKLRVKARKLSSLIRFEVRFPWSFVLLC